MIAIVYFNAVSVFVHCGCYMAVLWEKPKLLPVLPESRAPLPPVDLGCHFWHCVIAAKLWVAPVWMVW